MDFVNLKNFFKIENDESVIITFRVPLSIEERNLPFGILNNFYPKEISYDLYAELKVQLRSIFPELENAELSTFWENKNGNKIEFDETEKLTLDELKIRMQEMSFLEHTFKVKSVPRSTKNDFVRPKMNFVNHQRLNSTGSSSPESQR